MKNFTLLFAALFAVLLTSCQKEGLNELTENNDLTEQSFDTALNISGKNSPKKTIAQFLQDDENFSLFYEALEHTNLVSLVSSVSDITVFAPNNLAMKALLGKGQYGSIQEIQPALLKKIMYAHISITGMHTISSDERGQEIAVLYENKGIYMKTTDATLHFGNSVTNIDIANQQQTNGIIHQINGVLIP